MKSASIYILGSNVIAQLIVIGSTPFLTRAFSKAEFGWFGVGTTLAVLLATVLSLRLEHSIHLKQSESARVYNACLCVIGVIGVFVVLPALWLVNTDIVGRSTSNIWFVWLFAMGHAALAGGTLFLNAQQRFRMIALVNLIVPVIFVGGALSMPDLFRSANQLLVWQSIAYATAAAISIGLNRKELKRADMFGAFNLIKREKQSVIFLVPSSLMSIFTLNLPVLITTAMFSESAAGLVVIAQRVARAPITVIGNGLNEVLRSTIPQRHDIKRVFNRVFQLCVAMSALMLLITWLIPESVYLWLLGDDWTGLRVVLFATVFGAVFQLLGTSVMSLLSSFAKPVEFWVNFLLLIVGILAAIVAWFLALDNLFYLWLHMLFSAGIFLYALSVANTIANREALQSQP